MVVVMMGAFVLTRRGPDGPLRGRAWSIEWRWISGSGEECRLNEAEVWERGAGLSSHTFHTGEGLL